MGLEPRLPFLDAAVFRFAWRLPIGLKLGALKGSRLGAGSGATASHTYASAGSYTVTLKVTDDDGATNSSSQSVTVATSGGGGGGVGSAGSPGAGVLFGHASCISNGDTVAP